MQFYTFSSCCLCVCLNLYSLDCKLEKCVLLNVAYLLLNAVKSTEFIVLKFHGMSSVLRLLWSGRQGGLTRFYLSKGGKKGGVKKGGGKQRPEETINGMREG